MLRRVRPLTVALLVAALVATGCSSDTGAPDDAPTALSLSTGTGPLPVATFADLRDPDVEVATTDWEGTPTVVNFWATWCGFCIDEMPDLQAASEELDGAVRFVGIDRQDPRDEALAFLEETGVTYDQVASPSGDYYTRIGARGMPTTLFVDAAGVVQHRHTGPLTRADVLELVGEHLGVSP